MKTSEIRKEVSAFRSENSLTDISYESLCASVESMGYTVIEFDTFLRDKNVRTLVEEFDLNTQISNSRGFIYANGEFRLVFINEALSDNEKALVLAHEAGHIALGHTTKKSVFGNEVSEEHEANEFAHYLLNPDSHIKAAGFFNAHKKAVIALVMTVIIAFSAIGIISAVHRNNSYAGDFYVTQSGEKYHRKNCIFVKDKKNTHRLTQEEFDSGEYEACEICLPDD